jgi:hypothetical protein
MDWTCIEVYNGVIYKFCDIFILIL